MSKEFKEAANEKLENMKRILKEKGMEENEINQFLEIMNKAIDNTAKQIDNEQN